jgi:hypothetical protein
VISQTQAKDGSSHNVESLSFSSSLSHTHNVNEKVIKEKGKFVSQERHDLSTRQSD